MTQRVTLITGGSSGVGEAVALQLAGRGESVVINFSRNRALADGVVAACQAAGGQAIAAQGDVASDASCREVAEAAMAAFGRIDGLVNCAATTQFVPMNEFDGVQAEDFLRVYGVNAVGPFQMARAAARHMGPGSAIVSVSSIAGQTGSGSSFPYVMSKAALNILTVGLARNLAPRVRVNAVLPGMIEGRWMRDGLGEASYQRVKQDFSDLSALGKISQPEDIARAVVWLLEPDAVITGQMLKVDAGFTLGRDRNQSR